MTLEFLSKHFSSSSLPPYLAAAWALEVAPLLTFLPASQLPLLSGSVHVKMFNFSSSNVTLYTWSVLRMVTSPLIPWKP